MTCIYFQENEYLLPQGENGKNILFTDQAGPSYYLKEEQLQNICSDKQET